MLPRIAVIGVLLISAHALAAEATLANVDLRDPDAIEQLQRSNPAHFERIRQIVSGLREQPQRAQSDWLQVNFDARDVDLSRYLMRTSNPPKQLLQFTLDNVRYTMHVTRSDLTANIEPAQSVRPLRGLADVRSATPTDRQGDAAAR